jgi:hypothetical protein
VVHSFSNPHQQTARALVILTPDIGAQYFRDIAEVVSAAGGRTRSRKNGERHDPLRAGSVPANAFSIAF